MAISYQSVNSENKEVLIKSCLIVGFTILDVAAGSPGPFDKKIPSGFRATIVSKFVLIGTTVILVFKFEIKT